MHGTNKQSLIVDADAIIAFVSIEDANHIRAKTIMKYLASSQADLLYPVTAVCEAVTVLQRKLNNPEKAGRVVEKFQSGDFPLFAIDQTILTEAGGLFKPHGSKQNTLFDAVVAAIAKRQKANAIFSFDQWYKKQGFMLAGDLLQEEKEAA